MAVNGLDEATAKEVIRQVEFYFSDSNIPRDKFLRNTIDNSDDGMINLALICTFNKMKGYLKLKDVTQQTIPNDIVQKVAETLRISSFLRVSEDGKKIGRISALLKPEEVIEQLDIRTVAASPLEYDTKREDVEAFFSQHAKVSSVRLPRHMCDKRVFCGTALIEFLTKEDAQGILSKSLLYDGVQLDLKPKKEFDAERKEAEEHERSQASSRSEYSSTYTKGLIMAFKLQIKPPSPPPPSSPPPSSPPPLPDVSAEENAAQEGGSLGKVLENAPQESEPASENMPIRDVDNTATTSEKEEGIQEAEETGTEINEAETEEGGEDAVTKKKARSEEAVEKVRDRVEKRKLEDSKNNVNVILREDLKAAFQEFGAVKFVDFKMGDEAGFVRFEQPEAAQKARAAAVLSQVGGLMVKNFLAIVEPVTGDVERDYWALLRDNQEKCWENKSNNGGGRGGKLRGRGKHHRNTDKDSGRPTKVPKVEEASRAPRRHRNTDKDSGRPTKVPKVEEASRAPRPHAK